MTSHTTKKYYQLFGSIVVAILFGSGTSFSPAVPTTRSKIVKPFQCNNRYQRSTSQLYSATSPPSSLSSLPRPILRVSLDRPVIPEGLLPAPPPPLNNVQAPHLLLDKTPLSADTSSVATKKWISNNLFNVPMMIAGIKSVMATIKGSLASLFQSNIFRILLAVYVTYVMVWLTKRSTLLSATNDDESSNSSGAATSVDTNVVTAVIPALSQVPTKVLSNVKSTIQSVKEKILQPNPVGIPMPYESYTDRDGWGICTLQSRRRLGKTSFFQYDFKLPEDDYTLGLELGQPISLCCLDKDGGLVQGNFFPFSPPGRPNLGSFSILAPNRSPEYNSYAIGKNEADLVRVLKSDMRVGSEIALKPGKSLLQYRGEYLPVTDMLYIACGLGIVPVLEQVRAVLPRGASSVKSAIVVWINEETKDFDVISNILERDYYSKFKKELTVSCVVDDLTKHPMAENVEIDSYVPDFVPGTMAIVSGPKFLVNKSMEYLVDRGYPETCICAL